MISGAGGDFQKLFTLPEILVPQEKVHVFVCFLLTGFIQEPVFFYVPLFFGGKRLLARRFLPFRFGGRDFYIYLLKRKLHRR